jgi:hypothetical protein
MATHHILYFTSDAHWLYSSVGKTLTLEARFSADDAGVHAFREHLRGSRGALYALLADLAGEDFHEDQIPFLRGADREAVLQRRLAQRYRDTRLAAALSLGYVSTGERRNERLLLASFTNTQQLAPWLDALEEAGVKLTGVYSVPLLAPVLAAKLRMRASRTFVVTANRSGLRQCYIEEGRLRFARLERIADMAPSALAAFVHSETVRLAQYLTTLRALPREGAPVQVLVVAPPGERALFEQSLASDSRLSFRTVELVDASRASGLARIPDGCASEALYVHLAARKAPREQFASTEDRRPYVLWQLQRGIVAAGATAFTACALYGAAIWLDAAGARSKTEEEQRLAKTATDQYQRITAAFPVTQTSSENLKVAAVEFRRIAERTASPEPALLHVSRVLERFPQIELDIFIWSVGRDERRKADAAAEPAVLLELSGRVNATQRTDYRGITAQVRRFAEALGGYSGYELVRTQLPFDITSEGTLTGDTMSGDSSEAPRFTIVLSRRLR